MANLSDLNMLRSSDLWWLVLTTYCSHVKISSGFHPRAVSSAVVHRFDSAKGSVSGGMGRVGGI